MRLQSPFSPKLWVFYQSEHFAREINEYFKSLSLIRRVPTELPCAGTVLGLSSNLINTVKQSTVSVILLESFVLKSVGCIHVERRTGHFQFLH